eukprot:2874818-Amphidinium_carterae.1
MPCVDALACTNCKTHVSWPLGRKLRSTTQVGVTQAMQLGSPRFPLSPIAGLTMLFPAHP